MESMEPGYTLEIEGCIKGYHIYREKPRFHEKLACEMEPGNRFHKRAVVVVKPRSGDIVGRVPRGFGSSFWRIFQLTDKIECVATGKPHVSTKPWPEQLQKGGGAIIPCVYVASFFNIEDAEAALEDIKNAISRMGMTKHLRIVTEQWAEDNQDDEPENGEKSIYFP